jgi:DNA primase
VKIDELKQHVTISQVVMHFGGDVPMFADSWVSMRCPFHDDRVNSASISDEAGQYFCHACGANGDILDVVQSAMQFADVTEAKQWIEENLLVPEEEAPPWRT